jgi:hypothetical protein
MGTFKNLDITLQTIQQDPRAILKRIQTQILEKGYNFSFTGDVVNSLGQFVRSATNEVFTIGTKNADRQNMTMLFNGTMLMADTDTLIFTTEQGVNLRMTKLQYMQLYADALQYGSTLHFVRRSILDDIDAGQTFTDLAGEFQTRLTQKLTQ